MSSLGSLSVTGANNPSRQVSSNRWNDLVGSVHRHIANRTDLAASDTVNPVFLREAGREGVFVFSSSNLSANVTADSNQGIYVAPSSDTTGASGAWVRKFSGAVNVKWFGATGDGTTNDSTAVLACLATIKAIGVNYDGFYGKGSLRMYLPAGTYNMGTTPLEVSHTLVIEGDGTMFGYGTRLKWTGDCDGIRIEAYNTTGTSTVDPSPYHVSAEYTTLRGLELAGPYYGNVTFSGGTEGEYHGIRVKSNVVIEDCAIEGFAGDGVYANTGAGSGGTSEGNSNCSFINRLRVRAVRNGVFLEQSDSSAWTVIGVIGTYCRQHTIWDSSFLGNTHIGHHSANAGLVPNVPPCMVSSGGIRYFVKQGQASGASTNSPKNATVTITIASPGVVSWTAHGLSAGTAVAFSTTGALPTGLSTNNVYYVINPTANDFQVSSSPTGPAINTSGTQSGTHTAGADNAYWLCNGVGGTASSLNIAAWSSGTTYREGGSYLVDSANSYSNWIGFYVEGGEPAPQFIDPAINIMGGLVGGSRDLITTGQWFSSRGLMVGGKAVVGARQLGWTAPTGTAYRGTWDPSTVTLSTLAQVVKAMIDDLGSSAGGMGQFDA